MNTDRDQPKIKLEDAIRDHYRVTPLERDLAEAVLKRLPRQQPVYALEDRWSHGIGIVLLLAGMLYGITLLNIMQAAFTVLLGCVIALTGLTAWKEINFLQRFVSAADVSGKV